MKTWREIDIPHNLLVKKPKICCNRDDMSGYVLLLDDNYTAGSIVEQLKKVEIIAIGGISKGSICFFTKDYFMPSSFKKRLSYIFDMELVEEVMNIDDDEANYDTPGIWTFHNVPLDIQIEAFASLIGCSVEELRKRLF
jgi:hypothetical protein